MKIVMRVDSVPRFWNFGRAAARPDPAKARFGRIYQICPRDPSIISAFPASRVDNEGTLALKTNLRIMSTRDSAEVSILKERDMEENEHPNEYAGATGETSAF